MNHPKIKFEPMTLEENINLIKWAYFEDNSSLDIHNYTIQYFPELSNLRPNCSKQEIYGIIEKVVSKDYEKSKTKIKNETDRYNKIWKPYNDKYFEALSNYLNTTFPDDIKIIKASVGKIPVFPRYLDTFSFSISTGADKNKIIKTCAHESCHFLWFIKWKQLYPNCPKKEYDSPYNPWKYSEMVVDPILNSKEINSVINVSEKAYDIFYKIKDKDNLYMMDILQDIYGKDNPIEEKIKNGYEYICSILNRTK